MADEIKETAEVKTVEEARMEALSEIFESLIEDTMVIIGNAIIQTGRLNDAEHQIIDNLCEITGIKKKDMTAIMMKVAQCHQNMIKATAEILKEDYCDDSGETEENNQE